MHVFKVNCTDQFQRNSVLKHFLLQADYMKGGGDRITLHFMDAAKADLVMESFCDKQGIEKERVFLPATRSF